MILRAHKWSVRKFGPENTQLFCERCGFRFRFTGEYFGEGSSRNIPLNPSFRRRNLKGWVRKWIREGRLSEDCHEEAAFQVHTS